MFIAHRFPNSLPEESIVKDVSEIPILGKPLGELQDWAVKQSGGKWSTDAVAQLWIREDVHVSHQAIALFLKSARGADKDVQWRAEGAVGGFVREIEFDDDTPMMVWLAEPNELDLDRLNRAEVLLIDVTTHFIPIPAPQGIGKDLISLPVSEEIVIPVGHWSQTLWGNLLSMGFYLLRELVTDNTAKQIYRFGMGIVLSRSIDPQKIFLKIVQKGKDCNIHPSAVVEACWIGDSVTIGANAVVRGCILRDKSRVEELAIVEGAVLSKGAVVQRQGMVKFAVLSERATVAGVVQLGVLGQNAAVKRGGYLMDMNFGGLVQVQYNGVAKDAPLGVIGCSVGKDTKIGLGVAVAAGRAVPSGLKVVMHPDQMLRSVVLKEDRTDEESLLVCVDKGRLRGLHAD